MAFRGTLVRLFISLSILLSIAGSELAIMPAGADQLATKTLPKVDHLSVPPTSSTSNYALSTISCPDVSHCMVVGSDGSGFITTDGGSSWTSFTTGVTGLLFGVTCIDDLTCIAVGESGTIVTTSDFGTSWTAQVSGTGQMLFSVSCPSTTQCWVGGDNGVILTTQTGGASWVTETSNTTNSYFSMSCPSTLICVAGSNSNNISYTNNGGASWLSSPVPLVEGYFGMDCPSLQVCVGVGSGSSIVSSTNSGTTFQVDLPGSSNLYQQALWSVSCASITTCQAVGNDQLLATTTNGGSTWSFSRLPVVDTYLGISCPTVLICFVAGGSGDILETTNGGSSWTSSHTPSLASTNFKPLLLVGDSMANTLGVGLAQVADWYGYQVYNDGILGCGVDEGQPIILNGTSENVNGNCNGQPSPTNLQLEQIWQDEIDQINPSVVVLLAGRWEAVDRNFNGTMSNITQTSFQAYTQSQLNKAAEILTSRGAHLVLLTSPYFSEPGPAPGQIYDQDQPARVDIYNSLLYKVAADFPSKVSVLDLNSLVDPNGSFSQYISGVEVRSDDGVHFAIPGGEWIGEWLFPQLNQVTPSSLSSTEGYWMVGSDGSIYSYGTAQFLGSMAQKPLSHPIVGIAVTPDGQGYWEVASDGGIFAFGDASFYGSMGAKPLNEPIVGIAATPDGQGYWEVASDGGIFAFGDANFYGSTGNINLAAPIVFMTYDPETSGYWLAAADGGVFSFGPNGLTSFYGSAAGSTFSPVVGMAGFGGGSGYWLATRSGAIFGYGQASPVQSNIFPADNIVGIASTDS